MDAIYARQSIDRKDGVSISVEAQIDYCKKECCGDYNTYIDKGYSGKNLNRPAYQKMMKDIKAGKIQKVVVYRLDRLSRSILDFGNMWNVFEKSHTEFVSINEKFDTSTPIGRAMVYIIMIFAQLERETISERIRDNSQARLKMGSWTGGKAPFGFSNARESSEGRSQATITPNENMEIYIKAIKKYSQPGISLGNIVQMFRDEGIKESRNGAWHCSTVSHIFKNPAFVKCDANIYFYYLKMGFNINNTIDEFDGTKGGMRHINKNDDSVEKQIDFYLGNWAGVIDSELWLRVQEKLSNNIRVKRTGKGKHTWLSGYMKCGYCKYSIAAKISSYHQKTYINLYCQGRFVKICDHSIRFTLQEIEECVEKEVCKLLEKMKEFKCEEEEEPDSIAKIELAKIDIEIQNLIDCIKMGGVAVQTMQYINEEINDLEEKRKIILESATKILRPKMVEDIDFKKLDFEEKKVVVSTLIKKVYVYDDRIVIDWLV